MPNETDLVKKLRQKTGAGILHCRKALQSSSWDIEKAIEALRKQGLKLASKRSGRQTKAGKVDCYIHGGGKIGVMIEVNCETDFVARTEEFCRFVKDVAMQIAAAGAQYIEPSEVPPELLDKEKEILKANIKGKPDNVVEKIVQGKINKFYEEVCLLNQPFIKNDKLTIGQCLTELIAKTGENIKIKRFAKFSLGD
jgi:elongation factor Ts